MYNDRLRPVITHVIYSFMTIQNHMKNLASLMIILLANHSIILERSWIRKHEMMYSDHDNNLIFFSKHCNHLDASSHSFFKILNMKSKLIEKVVSAKFSSKSILQRNDRQTSRRSKSKKKESSRLAIKPKKKTNYKRRIN